VVEYKHNAHAGEGRQDRNNDTEEQIVLIDVPNILSVESGDGKIQKALAQSVDAVRVGIADAVNGSKSIPQDSQRHIQHHG
jgi:hypothetical protein